MIGPRKLTMQLTPLIDLLLIVMFAQFLEVESAVLRETTQLESSRDLLSSQLDEALRQILALRERMAELQDEVHVAETRSVDAERFRVQRDLIGEMVAEMFRVPEAAVNQLLQQRNAAGPGPSAADMAQLRTRLKALAGNSPERVVDHLLAFGEMRKRIDLWELYLSDTGALVLTVGEKKFPLRAESTEDIVARIFEAYKTLPESKSMVLILFTYGDAKFKPLKATLDSLPRVLEQIRLDAGQRSRFEYAVLGFRPAGKL
ncbi:MAG: hypothetical protein SFV23_10525 [Planctomycetaceae bacterium]|nr:hypothetical protein [Planctomycetaceae bacterium]